MDDEANPAPLAADWPITTKAQDCLHSERHRDRHKEDDKLHRSICWAAGPLLR